MDERYIFKYAKVEVSKKKERDIFITLTERNKIR